MEITNDRGLSDLLAEGQETVLCGGFAFTEGAIWVKDGGFLLFSDIPGDTIHRWAPGESASTPYRKPSRYANGNTIDTQGQFISCEHVGRQVTIAVIGQPERVLTDRLEGKRYNSPNDVVVHSGGAIYFTDPTYGIRQGSATGIFAEQEQDCQGVYRVDPDGRVSSVLRHFGQPNGLAFSPDEAHLYVADSDQAQKKIYRYEVQGDGSLAGETLFVDMLPDGRPGVPDGMKLDEAGRLWTTGAGGVWVLEADGTVLGQFETNEHAANLCFGGPDFRSLFLCTRTTISRIETNVCGVAPGSR